MSQELATVNIKGKDYVLVNERLKAFRNAYSGWSIETEIIELTNERCVMQAVIKDDKGTTRATGTAYEMANSSFINKTSYIENCETSAWGRALGCLGIGIDTSIASAEEVQTAIENQKEQKADEQVPAELIDEPMKRNINGLIKQVSEKHGIHAKTILADLEKRFGKLNDSMTKEAGVKCYQYLGKLLEAEEYKAAV